MPVGPGRYDDELTELREKIGAEGAILIVYNGKHGSGFSAQLPAELTRAITDVLQGVIDQIRADIADQDDQRIFGGPRAAVDDDRAHGVCLVGKGPATCRWLARDGRGWICTKKDPALRRHIERDADRMGAKGDNCEGIDPT